MTIQEHKMLVEIHNRIKDTPTVANLNKAATTVTRRIVHFMQSNDEASEPSNETRKRQVQAVRKLLDQAYREERKLSLHAACLDAWQPIMNGYPSPKSLYEYCHEHESEF